MQPARNIVLCLDGTWNNAYREKERDDGTKVAKPSNPLKMSRAVLPWSEAGRCDQLTYYDIGVGAVGEYPGVSNRLLGWVDQKLGGAFGAGFEANVEAAASFLVDNHRAGDRVYLFGFSRGAAQARGLTRFIDWLGGLPTKRDAYFLPYFYRAWVVSAGRADPLEVRTSSGRRPSQPLAPVTIELLGVWDTVMALGSRFRESRGTAVEERSFHVGATPARCVRHARQGLAVDERRFDFRPEVWAGSHPGQTLEQRWFAGVHSNVGGGYLNDGLANVPFRWLVAEARRLGLETDTELLKFYKPYPQDELYESMTMMYAAVDAVRLRWGQGVRRLVDRPATAKLVLDKSVIHRLRADPGEHERLELYRPRNVLELLAAQPDLDAYLAGLGLEAEDRGLPADVMARIRSLRGRS